MAIWMDRRSTDWETGISFFYLQILDGHCLYIFVYGLNINYLFSLQDIYIYYTYNTGTEKRAAANDSPKDADKTQLFIGCTHIICLAWPLTVAHWQQYAGSFKQTRHYGKGQACRNDNAEYTLHQVGADNQSSAFCPCQGKSRMIRFFSEYGETGL